MIQQLNNRNVRNDIAMWKQHQMSFFVRRSRPVDMSALSEAELNAELDKGYADIKAGRTSVFEDDEDEQWNEIYIDEIGNIKLPYVSYYSDRVEE